MIRHLIKVWPTYCHHKSHKTQQQHILFGLELLLRGDLHSKYLAANCWWSLSSEYINKKFVEIHTFFQNILNILNIILSVLLLYIV